MEKTLHPIHSFGILKVSLNSIRIETIQERVHPKVPFPHKHDFYQIMIVTHGQGWHQIDFKKHKISKQQIFVMKPGQVHSWVLAKGIKGHIIEFNRDSLQPHSVIQDIFHLPDLLTLKRSDHFSDLIKICDLMSSELRKEEKQFDLALQGLLISFLIKINRLQEANPKRNMKSATLIERFHELVEMNFRSEHRVDFYAQNLGVTPKALTMQLTRYLNKSPRTLIQERVLLEAERMLAFSQMSVADIGYGIGFEDANYFSRFFRLHEKITPAKFRQKLLL